MRNLHYILDAEHNVVPAELIEWAKWLKDSDRVVKQEDIGPYWISTVFLGLDHNYLIEGPPLVFETMIRNERENSWLDYQTRCATWAEAEAMHQEALAYVRELLS
jgi:hypothetical protein